MPTRLSGDDTHANQRRDAPHWNSGIRPVRGGRRADRLQDAAETIKGKPVQTTADARVTYVRLTPEQFESLKRFGYTVDVLRVRAKFQTTFTDHGMQIPQLLALKVVNEIQLETDLTLVRK